jgi:hypothetical protein
MAALLSVRQPRRRQAAERLRAEPTIDIMENAAPGGWSRNGAVRLGMALFAVILLAGATTARAGTTYVDGISDQSLPAWDGSFTNSSFAGFFRATWSGQISLARYVLQWNVMAEASHGPNPQGDYRERFEAWLGDVRNLGLTPVVALTSYDHEYPSSGPEYQQELEALLDDASESGYPIGYIEAWNEPNNQGEETAGKAGEIADWANAVCNHDGCQVIAGDLEDNTMLLTYEQEYLAALTFVPEIWGIHPYHSVKAHSDASILRFIRALPNQGAGAQIWFTEVAAYYCAHGQVRGEAQQASDASYLVRELIPAIAPTHVFYYGFMAGSGAEVPCAAGSGFDTELYRASHQARIAAGVIFSAGADPPLLLRSRLSAEPPAFARGAM